VDHRAEGPGDRQARRRRRAAADEPVRRSELRRDHPPRFSRRAADLLPQHPVLAAERSRKRADLLAATGADLATIRKSVMAGRLTDPDKIGIRVGKVIGKRKVGKHFITDIGPGRFSYRQDEDKIAAEAALDGIYVIRTSVDGGILDAAGGGQPPIRTLKYVERDFRITKADGPGPAAHPPLPTSPNGSAGHVLICMLACYPHLAPARRPGRAHLHRPAHPRTRRPGRPRPPLSPGQGQDATKHNSHRLPVRSYQDPARPPGHPRPADHQLRRTEDRETH